MRKTEEEKKKEWEEAMLENNSYYDIDVLQNANKKILERLDYRENKYKASGNMGKWWASIQIEKLRKKLQHYK